MSEENKAVIRRWIEELNQGNLDAADEFFAPNYVDHSAPPGTPPGPEGVKQLMAMYSAAFSDVRITIEDQIAEGDKVVTRLSTRLTHTGEFMGIAPTGKQVAVTAIVIDRIVGGKLVEAWESFDELGMMQQLGVIPPMGEGGE